MHLLPTQLQNSKTHALIISCLPLKYMKQYVHIRECSCLSQFDEANLLDSRHTKDNISISFMAMALFSVDMFILILPNSLPRQTRA